MRKQRPANVLRQSRRAGCAPRGAVREQGLRPALSARVAVFLAGSFAACQPSHTSLPSYVDGGSRASPDASSAHSTTSAPVADASKPALDAAPHSAAPSDASMPYVSSDTGDAASDAETPRDFCGNVLPATPSASGVLEDSLMFLPAIEQQPSVKVRGPAFSAFFDTHVLWIFGATDANTDPTSLVASSSYALSSLDHPFMLDEATDSTAPANLLPELAEDRAQAGADAELSYELGNPLVLPLGGALLFYGVSARVDATTTYLGTRVARLVAGTPIKAKPESALLFSATQPAFRSSVVANDGHAYLYGCAGSDAGYDCKLARVEFDSIAQPTAYQYRTVGGWSNDATAATVVVANVGATLSVSYNEYLQSFLLASLVPMTHRITLQTAARPEGPWTELGQLTVPTGDDDKATPTYAIEHAELSSNCGKTLVLTYVTPVADNQAELRPVQVELR